jgi:phosphatidylethanolamine/phosphatidyl-N-methylethanolamine N-methyltransferase
MESFDFFRNFLKNPSAVGSLIPSSKALARLMTKTAKVQEADVIVEFGTGSGVFTEQIQKDRKKGSHFFAFEINEEFATMTQERCPDIQVYNESAAQTLNRLKEHNLSRCNCIVSGLPWATLPEDIQNELFSVMFESLAPNGIFVTFGYVQSSIMPSITRFRERLEHSFQETGVTQYVWSNIPPARVYWARK